MKYKNIKIYRIILSIIRMYLLIFQKHEV